MLELLVSSLVELAAALIACSEGGCTGWEVWAIIAGALSAFVLLMFYIVSWAKVASAAKMTSFLYVFLFLWWMAAAVTLTFWHPFKAVGNGYFATWISFFLAFRLFSTTRIAGSSDIIVAATV
jgi:hypothetical protein|uniref:MARVEL domain-containing protein n=1 Tax=Eutreptiella gymnastica TaxID=73025 RepID=A0A6T1URZ3_9EUGL